MAVMNKSHRTDKKDLLSLKELGWFSCFFFASSPLVNESANPTLINSMNLITISRVSFRKTMIMNRIWMCTLMIALPINVAVKNVLNGILKWPLVIPARSKRGLGIDAQAKIVQNPYFYIWLKMNSFALSITFRFYFRFNSAIYSI